MTDLKYALRLLEDGEFTWEQTIAIDAALSGATVADIPDADVKNVIEYIDVHLIHNNVSQATRSSLELLQIQFRSR